MNAIHQRRAIADKMQQLIDRAEAEARTLTDEEVNQFNRLDSQLRIADRQASGDLTPRDRMQQLATSQGRRTEHVQPGREARIGDDRMHGATFDFKDETRTQRNERLYRAGQWALANIFGNAAARQWCNDHLEQRAQGTGDFTKGGALTSTEMERSIIWHRDDRGVFRRYADVWPMSEMTAVTPMADGGLTAYPVTENAASGITESTATFKQIELVAKEWGILNRVSRALNEDSVINLADHLSREAGWAFANSEDLAGFNGDGSSTYHGMRGITTKINDGNHAASIATAATGNTAFSTLDLADFNACVAKLPTWAHQGAAWYISQVGYAEAIERLMDTAGGLTPADMTMGWRMMFKGFPVVISNVLNSTTGAQTSTIVALLGNLKLSSRLGDRRGFNLLTLTERYAEFSQIGLLWTERFDINSYNLGDGTTAGGIIALKTASS